MASLGARSISAVFWGAGGSAVRLLMQIATQIVLARLLGPTEYGVFAVGSIVISFSGFFSDIGLAYGLIQKREVSDRDVRFVFTWQIVMGLLVSIAVAWGAGPVAIFFGEPRAEPVVRALAVICLINALAAPAGNLLKRALDFKTQQLAFLISYLIGYVLVGIPMALSGFKVWALVAAWLTQSSINGLLLYFATRHAVKPLLWYEQARAQGAYGGTVLATNLLNWTIGSIDRVIVGRVLPNQSMGLYATTYNLLYNPTASVLGVLQPVFFSASARAAEDNAGDRLERGFITLVAGICLIVMPVFAVLAAMAPTFILALYGAKWIGAELVCRPLALAMPLFLIWGMSTPLLWASGNASREFRIQWPLALFWGGACWWLAHYGGVEAVAWGVLGQFAARCALTLRMVFKVTSLRAIAIWNAARGGILMSAALAAAACGLNAMVSEWPAILRLAVVAIQSLIMLIVGLKLVPILIAPELGALLIRITHKLPPRLAAQLAFLKGRGTIN